MKILNPKALWLLFLLVPFAVIALFNYYQSWKAYLLLGGDLEKKSLFLFRFFCLAMTFLAFFTFAVLAYADIYFGKKAIYTTNSGLELVLIIDISNSMYAQDMEGTRLDFAKSFAQEITYSLPTAKKAVVVFKGSAITLTPLTTNNITTTMLLQNISPTQLTSPGSNMAAGLTAAMNLFSSDTNNKKIVVLLSDGEVLNGDTTRAVSLLYEKKAAIYAVGIGTKTGIDLVTPDNEDIVDKLGNKVHSRLEESALIDAARFTNGEYFEAATQNLNTLISDLKTYDQAEERIDYVNYSLFNFFTFLALLNLIIILIIRSAKWQILYG